MGHALEVAVSILNNLTTRVKTLMEAKDFIQPLPEFNGSQIVDSEYVVIICRFVHLLTKFFQNSV